MRAVNLIPGDQRSGKSVGVGRSEGGAYAVLVLLVAIAGLAVLYGKANREVASRKAQTASITAQAQRAQAAASQLAPYTSFIALRAQREQAVTALVDSRFDWAHAFHEFGRVLTGQTQIISLDGSIASGAATTTAAGAAAPAASGATTTVAPAAAPAASGATTTAASTSVASATPAGSVPIFTLTGCATSQPAVAQMLERLRLIDGVNTVTLLSSTKSAGSAGSSGGCPPNGPSFSVTVAFDGLPSAAASAAAAKPAGNTTVSDSTPSASKPGTTTVSSGGVNG
jgi:hypothetical protein